MSLLLLVCKINSTEGPEGFCTIVERWPLTQYLRRECSGSKPYGQWAILRISRGPLLTPSPLLARSSAAILCDREWVDKSPRLRTDFSRRGDQPKVACVLLFTRSGLVPVPPTTVPIMEEHDRSPSPNRSSLPHPLHRHLRSAPQSLRNMSAIVPQSPPPFSSGQRSTTDPEIYTYPPPPNSLRDLVLPPSENQQAETTHGWPIDVPQPDVPAWNERFPHPQRIGHAESYTRADYSSWGGSLPSPRKAHSSDWRPVPLGQYESYPRTPFLSSSLRQISEDA